MDNATVGNGNASLHNNASLGLEEQEAASAAAAPRFWVIPPFVLLIVVTCGANALVVVLTTTDRKLRGGTYIYIPSLAAADFMVGLMVMSGMMVYSLFGAWPLGAALCTVWQVFDFAMCSVSMLHLCIIAFDRFVATVYPLSSYLQHPDDKQTRAKVKLAAAWVTGVLLWLPAILYFRHVEGGDLHSGECLFVPNLVFTVVQASVVYYLPMLVIGYFYGRVVHILYFRKLSLGGSTKDSRAPGCAGASKVSEGNTLDMRSDGNLKDGVGGKFKRQHFKARDFQKDKTADVMSSLRGSDSNGQVCKEPKSNNHSLVYYNSNFENKVSADRESSETKQLPGVQNEASLQDVVLADGTKTESRQVRFPRRLDICLVEREARTLRHVSWSVKQLRNTASGGVTRGAGVHGSRHGRRVTLTLGVVIAAYLVCWLPFTVAWPVHAFCRCLPAQFYDFTYWAAYINSTLNPFLYFLLNRDFRRALQRFRARCWRRGARDVCSNIHDFSSSCRC